MTSAEVDKEGIEMTSDEAEQYQRLLDEKYGKNPVEITRTQALAAINEVRHGKVPVSISNVIELKRGGM
jgi:hypothetical protein